MQPHATPADVDKRRHRPKTLTVFAAAFTAGAALAYGVDRVVDVHVVQVAPQVESEPIFVALRSLPQGSPVTIWDVALKDWPKAILPTTALKADASFEGMVLRHPIRQGQPLLSVQLVRDSGSAPSTVVAVLPPATRSDAQTEAGGSPPAAAPAPVTGERFTPATPADPPVNTAAVAEPPVMPEPTPEPTSAPMPSAAVVSAPTDEPPAVVETPASTTPADDPTVTASPAAAPTTTTDIDPMPVVASQPPVVDEMPDTAQAGDADVASPPEPSRAVASLDPPPGEPAAPSVAVVEDDQPTVADAVVPMPIVAPVPALPSTDIEQSLADVGRTTRVPERREPDASVLDRTTDALPARAEPRLPTQHLVIPERIALAADASFTQPPAPVAPVEEVVSPATAPARAPETATAAPGRVPATSHAPGRGAGGTGPGARKPAKPTRQPAGKTQAAAPRFWSAWLPQFSGGGRQR